jgi:hypothetical protein
MQVDKGKPRSAIFRLMAAKVQLGVTLLVLAGKCERGMTQTQECRVCASQRMTACTTPRR